MKESNVSEPTAEEWRPVVGFPGYEVSDQGRVRSYRLGAEPYMLKLSPHKKAYLKVGLATAAGPRTRLVHTLVTAAFLGPLPDGLETCHNNGKGRDNRLTNLRYDTRSNNHADKRIHGTMRKRLPPLTDEQVQSIRDLYATGEFTINRLAEKHRTEWVIVKRLVTSAGPVRWSEVDPPGPSRRQVRPAAERAGTASDRMQVVADARS